MALEITGLRVLSAESERQAGADVAGLLKIKGTEIQQRYTELMMLAAGPLARAAHAARRWKPAGRATSSTPAHFVAPLAATYFNMRKTTIYGGINEIQRNIVAQTVLGELRPWTSISPTTRSCCATRCASWVEQGLRLRAPPRASPRPAASRAKPGSELADLGLTGLAVPEAHGGMGFGAGRGDGGDGGARPRPGARALRRGRRWSRPTCSAPAARPTAGAWLQRIADGKELVVLAHAGAAVALPARPRRDASAEQGRRRWQLSGTKSVGPGGDAGRRLHRLGARRRRRRRPGRHRACSWSRAASRGVDVRAYPTQDGARAAELVLERRRRHRALLAPATAFAGARTRGRHRHRRALRRGRRRDGQAGRDDGRVHEHAQAVRRARSPPSRRCAIASPTSRCSSSWRAR